MAVKGTVAKAYATQKIKEAFGDSFVGEIDKKLYINCPEGGEIVQIAISMTCPKTPVGSPTKDGGIDFNNYIPTTEASTFTPAEISNEEISNIEELMRKVGIF